MSSLVKLIISFICLPSVLFANEENRKKDSLNKYEFSGVEIVGNKNDILMSTPGTVNFIDKKELELRYAYSGNEVFRTVPGIFVADEEGVGLRLNMGIRGLDPDRSRTLLVMEDGIPVALAPYGEPEMYYTPSIDRMSGIEILKGSGSIIYGPQTIGGVVNYLTQDPPEDSQVNFDFSGGSGGYLNTSIGYGDSFGSGGFITELYHKKADNIGLTNYTIFDFMTKAKFNLDANSSIRIKLGAYDEISNSTYVGLTQTMYDNGEYYTEIAPNDELDVKRYSGSLSYQKVLSQTTVINATLYGYNTTRFWKRQNFSRSSGASDQTGVVFGDTDVDGGAIYMRDGTGNRNREFNVVGVQPNIISEIDLLGFNNKINAGIRLHYEEAFEQRINGTNATANSGNLVADEVRTGKAFSAYVHDRIYFTDELVVSPGVRYENFNYEREIFRTGSNDTLINSSSGINSFIPGIGINYTLSNNYTFFAGMHRGFAPPRIKDAITNSGEALELDAELSLNYELGIRMRPAEYLSVESSIYMLDFENQIIPVSESSGGTGTGLVNGGETMHQGVEVAVLLDVARIFNLNSLLTLQTNFSYNIAEYSSDRFIRSGDETININGNSLPYAPEYMSSIILNYETEFGIGLNFSGTYIGEKYSDELNSVTPSNDGQSGLIASNFIANATLSYKLKSYNLGLFLSVKNIFDERYIASRRPQGIKVGLPRYITFGVDYSL